MAVITAIAVFMIGVFGSFLSKQMSEEFKAWTPWWLRHLLAFAITRLPEHYRERFAEEWPSYIKEIPGEMAKIGVAIGFVAAALKTSMLEKLSNVDVNRLKIILKRWKALSITVTIA